MFIKSIWAIQNNSPSTRAPSPARPATHCMIRTAVMRKPPLHLPCNSVLFRQAIQSKIFHTDYKIKFGRCQALYESTAVPTWSASSNHRTDTGSYHHSGPDPLDALSEYIAVFGRCWSSDRLVTRRLRALAALDPDFEQVVRARDEWRRGGLRVIVGRLVEKYGRPAPAAFDEAVDVLYTLIGFECFDTLAGPTRNLEEIVPVVQQLVRAALGLAEA